MHDDTQLQQLFAQAGRLDAADRARLVEQVPWGRLARDEQRAFGAELAALDRVQLCELAEGQWLALERVDGVAGLYDFDVTGELKQWLIVGRHLERLMEGDLWLENLPSKSTGFYLTLPAVL